MKALAAISMLVVLFASIVTAQTSATWDPELQLKLKAVGASRVSPDGKRVLYTVSEAVTTADKSEFVTQIWMAIIDTKKSVQLTFGEKSSTNQ
jgi:dipeptidyl aminopeptidase/acylaminoacyl peptidase